MNLICRFLRCMHLRAFLMCVLSCTHRNKAHGVLEGRRNVWSVVKTKALNVASFLGCLSASLPLHRMPQASLLLPLKLQQATCSFQSSPCSSVPGEEIGMPSGFGYNLTLSRNVRKSLKRQTHLWIAQRWREMLAKDMSDNGLKPKHTSATE